VILNYSEIRALLYDGTITGAHPDQVNGTSLDVTLGDTIMVEREPRIGRVVSLRERTPLTMCPHTIGDGGYILRPGEFILAHTRERFHLPLHLSAQYVAKSSMGRVGLDHMDAGWCDPGWHGSALTLELVNHTKYHSILLQPGDRIGQLVFITAKPVPWAVSYAVRGAYNQDASVAGPRHRERRALDAPCSSCGSDYHNAHECGPVTRVRERMIRDQEE